MRVGVEQTAAIERADVELVERTRGPVARRSSWMIRSICAKGVGWE
jgi:hypothetical protein